MASASVSAASTIAGNSRGRILWPPAITILPSTDLVITKVSGDTQNADSGIALSNDFVVNIKDTYGNIATAGTNVNFIVTTVPGGASGYSMSANPAPTDSMGDARSKLTLGNVAGDYIVTVSCAGAASVTFTATANLSLSLTILSGANIDYGTIAPQTSDETKSTQLKVIANPSSYTLSAKVTGDLANVSDPSATISGDPDNGVGFGWSNDNGASYQAFSTSAVNAIALGVNNATNTYICPTAVGGAVYTIKYKLVTDWTVGGGNYATNIVYTLTSNP